MRNTTLDTEHNTHCPNGYLWSPGSIITRPRGIMQPTVPVKLIARSSNRYDTRSNQAHLRNIIWVDTSYRDTERLCSRLLLFVQQINATLSPLATI